MFIHRLAMRKMENSVLSLSGIMTLECWLERALNFESKHIGPKLGHSVNKHLLNTYYVPGTVLSPTASSPV